MKKITTLNFLLLCLFLLFSFSGFSFAKNKVYHFQLKNGLTLLVKVDKRAPVVVSQVWYKVGGSYESLGQTGISHLLEHLMFSGTQRFPQGRFSKLIAQNGGQENAATSREYTFYYQLIAADKLALCLKLEADRMQNLRISKQAFAKELKVVQEERRMRTDNNPQSLTYERFAAAAYPGSPYQNPVVGWPADLRQMTRHNVQQWYQAWYAPNNATVVVVGDVNPQTVFRLVKKFFGKIPKKSLPELQTHPTQKATGTRTVTMNIPAKLPWVLLGFATPSLKTAHETWQPYALELAASILDLGKSSRLSSQLIRGSQVASSVGASYDLYSRLPGQFLIYASPSPKHSLAQVKQALLKQIRKLSDTPVSKEELERVKTQLQAQQVFAQDSLNHQARMIGSLQSVGLSWRDDAEFLQRIDKITPQQIQQVAQQYLQENNLTVALLQPKPHAKHHDSPQQSKVVPAASSKSHQPTLSEEQ